MKPPSNSSHRKIADPPRDLRHMLKRLVERGRGAAAAAMPIYRRILPMEVRARIPDDFRRTLRSTFGIRDRVQELGHRLNDLGFVERALDELNQLSENAKIQDRQLANLALALWHANQDSPEGAAAALASLDKGIDTISHLQLRRREAILRAECHAMLGNIEAARTEIVEALADAPHVDLYLAAANLHAEPGERIAQVNHALSLHGLASVSLKTGYEGPIYDALTVTETLPHVDGPKISVIIPAFNAAEHISTALIAVIAQTWKNLEVLVVDDHSADATMEILASFSKRDNRIRPIRLDVNRGSYVARNIGLREASGDFVTTHDADDWSHPQKLEVQVRHLIKKPRAAANMSQQARATSDLVFHRRGNPGHYLFHNMSSLMFRREAVLEKLGYWDSVRFGADSEFIERIRQAFGHRSLVSLTEAGPLSFQRQSKTSLTGGSVFGYHGFLMGARLAYHEASRRYHRVGQPRYEFPPKERPFAVPEPMWPKREVVKGQRRIFDVILVSDFRISGPVQARALAQIAKETDQNHRVGLVQMALYDFDPTASILSVFRDLEDLGEVRFIVSGEHVSCERLSVLQAAVLEDFQRFMPDIDTREVQVHAAMQGGSADLLTPGALSDWLEKCKENAKKYFGLSGEWSFEQSKLREVVEERCVGESGCPNTESPRE